MNFCKRSWGILASALGAAATPAFAKRIVRERRCRSAMAQRMCAFGSHYAAGGVDDHSQDD